jgi:hypothetical protein
MAGHGKCPDRDDFLMQAYLHAPRRPPIPMKWTSTECAKQCDAKATASGTLAAEGVNERILHLCVAVILEDAFDEEWIASLREQLVSS